MKPEERIGNGKTGSQSEKSKKSVSLGGEKTKKATSCDSCVNYVYDEDYEYYVCEANLDEDDMVRFLGNQSFNCPYYRLDDEYQVVRRQM